MLSPSNSPKATRMGESAPPFRIVSLFIPVYSIYIGYIFVVSDCANIKHIFAVVFSRRWASMLPRFQSKKALTCPAFSWHASNLPWSRRPFVCRAPSKKSTPDAALAIRFKKINGSAKKRPIPKAPEALFGLVQRRLAAAVCSAQGPPIKQRTDATCLPQSIPKKSIVQSGTCIWLLACHLLGTQSGALLGSIYAKRSREKRQAPHTRNKTGDHTRRTTAPSPACRNWQGFATVPAG